MKRNLWISCSFHIYLTKRKRGKTDTKAWSLLDIVINQKDICFAWIRRRWRDSLYCSKPLFEDLLYKYIEEYNSKENKPLKASDFEVQEKGLFYKDKRRIFFYDLFSYARARGGISRITFGEVIFEEAIPIDQDFLSNKGQSEQWMFRDLLDSLKRNNNNLKVTFLANPYIWSTWFLSNFETNGLLFNLKKNAEEKKKKKDNSGVLSTIIDETNTEWLLYINLIEGKPDAHSLSLEEKLNPSLRNWDEFMIPFPKKYNIIHAIQDYYFCEIGWERKKFKKYCLMYFGKNIKENINDLINFCFSLEDKASSKLIRCIIKEKKQLLNKWVNMLKSEVLKFTDFRSRDWFLEQIKSC